jgi:serine/threonine protein kinase
VKVLDFGLAKAVGKNEALEVEPSQTRAGAPTLVGVIVGTAEYMSPEQARGKPVDKRTDIWAFGCVLFEMLAGLPRCRRTASGWRISRTRAAPPTCGSSSSRAATPRT